jgi:hypothetical protein
VAKGDPLPAADHVLRYIKPTHFDRETSPHSISVSGFLCKATEEASSVNWMECFDAPIQNQCDRIRAEKRVTWAATG